MALDPIKISAYDELDETPAIGDLFVIVDISEGADIDKTKHVTMANLVNLADQAAIQEIVSSQAAGDTFYASAVDALARLAKGAGGQILK